MRGANVLVGFGLCIGLFWSAVLAIALIQVVLISSFVLKGSNAEHGLSVTKVALEFLWNVLPVAFLAWLIMLSWSHIQIVCL